MYSRIGKPVDKDEWLMTPQTVNAYYNPSTNEICFLAVALGGIKTKSTVVRKLKDQDGNLTGEEELQVSESELAPNLQAMSVWLYHHDDEWRKVERCQDEDADIPKDIDHGISIDSWIKDKLK